MLTGPIPELIPNVVTGVTHVLGSRHLEMSVNARWTNGDIFDLRCDDGSLEICVRYSRGLQIGDEELPDEKNRPKRQGTVADEESDFLFVAAHPPKIRHGSPRISAPDAFHQRASESSIGRLTVRRTMTTFRLP
jgi:hypothetical protein